MNGELVNLVAILAIAVLGVLVGVVLMSGAKVLKAQTSKIEDEVAREKIRNYIDIAEREALKTVKALNQTTVSTLKANGQWNKETGKKVLNSAIAILENNLSEPIKEAITSINTDFDKWCEDLIEFFVGQLK